MLTSGQTQSARHTNNSCNTGEAFDSYKFLGQGYQYIPVVLTWVYSARVATITTTSDNVWQSDRWVHV